MKHKIYKKSILSGLAIIIGFILVSCTDDFVDVSMSADTMFDESDIMETFLAVEVNNFAISMDGSTRAEPTEEPIADTEIMSDFEKTVDNIWVFQFDTDGNLVIEPRYYTAIESETDGTWSVLLKPVISTIYVVTNVNSDSWVSSVDNFMTINQLMAATLPVPYTIYDLSESAQEGHIPMQGNVEGVTPVSGGGAIEVPVEHMYAKVKVRVIFDKLLEPYNPSINAVYAMNCPWYCRIGTLYDKTTDSQDGSYPTNENAWITRSMISDGKGNNLDDPNNEELGDSTYDYVVYIPENIQGEVAVDDRDANAKAEILPDGHPTSINVNIAYTDENGLEASNNYAVYPGGNNYNNFNIRRNQVYRVTMILGSPFAEYTPSANSIVVHPGKTISFEPYYRVETGGGYNFLDYISPNSDEGTGQQIKGIKILWQTENCIGDNSAGDLVYFEASEPIQDLHDKIYVKANQSGNAVIAAYADEACEGDIIWSWHIWVTSEDPTNISNALTYYTYQWDSDGIYGEESGKARVPGYGVMPCNLGALSSIPASDAVADKVETYGLLYQWGRKDPFPALKTTSKQGVNGNFYDYTESTTEYLYDNSYERISGMTAGTTESYLFHSVSGTTIKASSSSYGVDFTIKNPTVFLCGSDDANKQDGTYLGIVSGESQSYYENAMANYTFGGDWMEIHDERLWGALPIDDNTMSCYVATEAATQDPIYIYDTYGSKSIFDPCPYGWRVSPPDQWLGFSYTGYNPDGNYDYINTNETGASGNEAHYGMELYMQAWKTGLTSYFPLQGVRAVDGSYLRPNRCGNYHNVTTDPHESFDRVNILHVHNTSTGFRIFEFENICFYSKACACPIRCVRDTK